MKQQKLSHEKKQHKLTALATLGIFILTSLTPAGLQAAPALSAGLSAPRPFGVAVPEKSGEIRGFYQGQKDAPLIVHLLDAHTQTDAQRNAAEIISSLAAGQKMPLVVLVEGAAGFVSAAPLRAFRDQGFDPSKFLLARGLTNGPELAAIQNKNVLLYGLEDPAVYDKHLSAWKKAVSVKAANRKFIRHFREKVREALWAEASPQLLDLLRISDELTADTPDLERLAGMLLKSVRTYRYELWQPDSEKPFNASDIRTRYPNLYRLIQLRFLWEISREALESYEAESLRNTLRSGLSAENEIEDAVNQPALALPADAGEGPADLPVRETLPEVFLPEYVDSRLPAGNSGAGNYLDKSSAEVIAPLAAKYRAAAQDIDAYTLLLEMRDMLKQLQERTFRSAKEAGLAALDSQALLLEKLCDLRLTPAEYEMLNQDTKMGEKDLLQRYQELTGVLLNNGENWNPAASLSYYAAALERDEILFLNLEEFLNNNPQLPRVVLFTGGFHAAGLAHRFHRSSMSYISVIPKIRNAAENDPLLYEKALTWSSTLAVRTPLATYPRDLVRDLAIAQTLPDAARIGYSHAQELFDARRKILYAAFRESSTQEAERASLLYGQAGPGEQAFFDQGLAQAASFFAALSDRNGTPLNGRMTWGGREFELSPENKLSPFRVVGEARSEVRSPVEVPSDYLEIKREQLGGYSRILYGRDDRTVRDVLRFFFSREDAVWVLTLLNDVADAGDPWSWAEVRRVPVSEFDPESLSGEVTAEARFRGLLVDIAGKVDVDPAAKKRPGLVLPSFEPLAEVLKEAGFLDANFTSSEWTGSMANVYLPKGGKLPPEGLSLRITFQSGTGLERRSTEIDNAVSEVDSQPALVPETTVNRISDEEWRERLARMTPTERQDLIAQRLLDEFGFRKRSDVPSMPGQTQRGFDLIQGTPYKEVRSDGSETIRLDRYEVIRFYENGRLQFDFEAVPAYEDLTTGTKNVDLKWAESIYQGTWQNVSGLLIMLPNGTKSKYAWLPEKGKINVQIYNVNDPEAVLKAFNVISPQDVPAISPASETDPEKIIQLFEKHGFVENADSSENAPQFDKARTGRIRLSRDGSERYVYVRFSHTASQSFSTEIITPNPRDAQNLPLQKDGRIQLNSQARGLINPFSFEEFRGVRVEDNSGKKTFVFSWRSGWLIKPEELADLSMEDRQLLLEGTLKSGDQYRIELENWKELEDQLLGLSEVDVAKKWEKKAAEFRRLDNPEKARFVVGYVKEVMGFVDGQDDWIMQGALHDSPELNKSRRDAISLPSNGSVLDIGYELANKRMTYLDERIIRLGGTTNALVFKKNETGAPALFIYTPVVLGGADQERFSFEATLITQDEDIQYYRLTPEELLSWAKGERGFVPVELPDGSAEALVALEAARMGFVFPPEAHEHAGVDRQNTARSALAGTNELEEKLDELLTLVEAKEKIDLERRSELITEVNEAIGQLDAAYGFPVLFEAYDDSDLTPGDIISGRVYTPMIDMGIDVQGLFTGLELGKGFLAFEDNTIDDFPLETSRLSRDKLLRLWQDMQFGQTGKKENPSDPADSKSPADPLRQSAAVLGTDDFSVPADAVDLSDFFSALIDSRLGDPENMADLLERTASQSASSNDIQFHRENPGVWLSPEANQSNPSAQPRYFEAVPQFFEMNWSLPRGTSARKEYQNNFSLGDLGPPFQGQSTMRVQFLVRSTSGEVEETFRIPLGGSENLESFHLRAPKGTQRREYYVTLKEWTEEMSQKFEEHARSELPSGVDFPETFRREFVPGVGFLIEAPDYKFVIRAAQKDDENTGPVLSMREPGEPGQELANQAGASDIQMPQPQSAATAAAGLDLEKILYWDVRDKPFAEAMKAALQRARLWVEYKEAEKEPLKGRAMLKAVRTDGRDVVVLNADQADKGWIDNEIHFPISADRDLVIYWNTLRNKPGGRLDMHVYRIAPINSKTGSLEDVLGGVDNVEQLIWKKPSSGTGEKETFAIILKRWTDEGVERARNFLERELFTATGKRALFDGRTFQLETDQYRLIFTTPEEAKTMPELTNLPDQRGVQPVRQEAVSLAGGQRGFSLKGYGIGTQGMPITPWGRVDLRMVEPLLKAMTKRTNLNLKYDPNYSGYDLSTVQESIHDEDSRFLDDHLTVLLRQGNQKILMGLNTEFELQISPFYQNGDGRLQFRLEEFSEWLYAEDIQLHGKNPDDPNDRHQIRIVLDGESVKDIAALRDYLQTSVVDELAGWDIVFEDMPDGGLVLATNDSMLLIERGQNNLQNSPVAAGEEAERIPSQAPLKASLRKPGIIPENALRSGDLLEQTEIFKSGRKGAAQTIREMVAEASLGIEYYSPDGRTPSDIRALNTRDRRSTNDLSLEFFPTEPFGMLIPFARAGLMRISAQGLDGLGSMPETRIYSFPDGKTLNPEDIYLLKGERDERSSHEAYFITQLTPADLRQMQAAIKSARNTFDGSKLGMDITQEGVLVLSSRATDGQWVRVTFIPQTQPAEVETVKSAIPASTSLSDGLVDGTALFSQPPVGVNAEEFLAGSLEELRQLFPESRVIQDDFGWKDVTVLGQDDSEGSEMIRVTAAGIKPGLRVQGVWDAEESAELLRVLSFADEKRGNSLRFLRIQREWIEEDELYKETEVGPTYLIPLDGLNRLRFSNPDDELRVVEVEFKELSEDVFAALAYLAYSIEADFTTMNRLPGVAVDFGPAFLRLRAKNLEVRVAIADSPFSGTETFQQLLGQGQPEITRRDILPRLEDLQERLELPFDENFVTWIVSRLNDSTAAVRFADAGLDYSDLLTRADWLESGLRDARKSSRSEVRSSEKVRRTRLLQGRGYSIQMGVKADSEDRPVLEDGKPVIVEQKFRLYFPEGENVIRLSVTQVIGDENDYRTRIQADQRPASDPETWTVLFDREYRGMAVSVFEEINPASPEGVRLVAAPQILEVLNTAGVLSPIEGVSRYEGELYLWNETVSQPDQKRAPRYVYEIAPVNVEFIGETPSGEFPKQEMPTKDRLAVFLSGQTLTLAQIMENLTALGIRSDTPSERWSNLYLGDKKVGVEERASGGEVTSLDLYLPLLGSPETKFNMQIDAIVRAEEDASLSVQFRQRREAKTGLLAMSGFSATGAFPIVRLPLLGFDIEAYEDGILIHFKLGDIPENVLKAFVKEKVALSVPQKLALQENVYFEISLPEGEAGKKAAARTFSEAELAGEFPPGTIIMRADSSDDQKKYMVTEAWTEGWMAIEVYGKKNMDGDYMPDQEVYFQNGELKRAPLGPEGFEFRLYEPLQMRIGQESLDELRERQQFNDEELAKIDPDKWYDVVLYDASSGENHLLFVEPPAEYKYFQPLQRWSKPYGSLDLRRPPETEPARADEESAPAAETQTPSGLKEGEFEPGTIVMLADPSVNQSKFMVIEQMDKRVKVIEIFGEKDSDGSILPDKELDFRTEELQKVPLGPEGYAFRFYERLELQIDQKAIDRMRERELLSEEELVKIDLEKWYDMTFYAAGQGNNYLLFVNPPANLKNGRPMRRWFHGYSAPGLRRPPVSASLEDKRKPAQISENEMPSGLVIAKTIERVIEQLEMAGVRKEGNDESYFYQAEEVVRFNERENEEDPRELFFDMALTNRKNKKRPGYVGVTLVSPEGEEPRIYLEHSAKAQSSDDRQTADWSVAGTTWTGFSVGPYQDGILLRFSMTQASRSFIQFLEKIDVRLGDVIPLWNPLDREYRRVYVLFEDSQSVAASSMAKPLLEKTIVGGRTAVDLLPLVTVRRETSGDIHALYEALNEVFQGTEFTAGENLPALAYAKAISQPSDFPDLAIRSNYFVLGSDLLATNDASMRQFLVKYEGQGTARTWVFEIQRDWQVQNGWQQDRIVLPGTVHLMNLLLIPEDIEKNQTREIHIILKKNGHKSHAVLTEIFNKVTRMFPEISTVMEPGYVGVRAPRLILKAYIPAAKERAWLEIPETKGAKKETPDPAVEPETGVKSDVKMTQPLISGMENIAQWIGSNNSKFSTVENNNFGYRWKLERPEELEPWTLLYDLRLNKNPADSAVASLMIYLRKTGAETMIDLEFVANSHTRPDLTKPEVSFKTGLLYPTGVGETGITEWIEPEEFLGIVPDEGELGFRIAVRQLPERIIQSMAGYGVPRSEIERFFVEVRVPESEAPVPPAENPERQNEVALDPAGLSRLSGAFVLPSSLVDISDLLKEDSAKSLNVKTLQRKLSPFGFNAGAGGRDNYIGIRHAQRPADGLLFEIPQKGPRNLTLSRPLDRETTRQWNLYVKPNLISFWVNLRGSNAAAFAGFDLVEKWTDMKVYLGSDFGGLRPVLGLIVPKLTEEHWQQLQKLRDAFETHPELKDFSKFLSVEPGIGMVFDHPDYRIVIQKAGEERPAKAGMGPSSKDDIEKSSGDSSIQEEILVTYPLNRLGFFKFMRIEVDGPDGDTFRSASQLADWIVNGYESFVNEENTGKSVKLTTPTIRAIVKTLWDRKGDYRFRSNAGTLEAMQNRVLRAVEKERRNSQEKRSEVRTAAASRALQEIEFSQGRQFVEVSASGLNEEQRQRLFSTLALPEDPRPVVLKEVSAPLRRPGDNLFLTLDTEAVLSEEFFFQTDERRLAYLIRDTAGGREVWVREGLTRLITQGGAVNTTASASMIQAAKESLNYQIRHMKAMPSSIHQTAHVLLTAETIRRNYNAARTAAYLAALGHKVMILEDTVMSNAREKFLSDYQFKALVESNLIGLIPQDGQLLNSVSRFIGKKIQPEDVILVRPESELADERVRGLNSLILADSVLGRQAGKRADFPAAVLGARLLLEPDKVREQYGDQYLVQRSAMEWYLVQTPEGGLLSDELAVLITGYQQISQAA